MDLSLLTSVSEYGSQRAGSRFTVRSASSPSYGLSRRSGIRKRETAGETGEISRHGTDTVSNVNSKKKDAASEVSSGSCISVKGQSEEDEASGYKTTVRLNQNDSSSKTDPESGSDKGSISSFESRGRTEWKKSNLVNRSKSLDWRSGVRSPDRAKRVDMPEMSTRRGEDTCKRASSLMERKTRVEGGVTSRVTQMSQTLEKGSWGNSLPSRLRSQSGSSCKSSETASSLGVKSGQSIMERIEKLFGSAGFGRMEDLRLRESSIPEISTDSLIPPRQKSYETTGGTFPRRFSTGDSNSPVRNWMPTIWTQKDTSPSQTLPFPQRNTTRDRSPGTQWHGQAWSRYSDGGGVTWRKGFVESGTRSLDRARSKYTVAAQIRAARAAAGISSPQQPNSLSEEQSVSSKDSFTLRERRASGSKIESFTIFGEEKRETLGINGMQRERIGKVTEEPKEDGVEENMDLKGGLIEEVFETNPLKITLKAVERRKITEKSSSDSRASVKNKINQFEALTQRGSETNHVPMPRRTFSVPAKLSRGDDGEKKSGSVRDRDGRKNKWEGLNEVGSGGKLPGTGKKLGSQRSLSVDEVGLRLERRETVVSDVAEEATNSTSDEFRKYSRLKNTLAISLDEGSQRNTRKFYIDETDFSKALSPEEKSESITPTLQLSGDLSPGDQEKTLSEITSQLSDDDKTPTNGPDQSPFMSPATQVEIATPSTDSKNKSTFVFPQEGNTQDAETPPLSAPPVSSSSTSSSSNPPEFMPPFIKTAQPRGRRKLMDLNAWITGLNPEYKGWNYDEDDYEDEDDDESTQKDDDSNYDSDSGESSVTVTSNMSQSDRKSFSLSLSELCNFTGAEYESENDSDEWQSTAGRSISLCSDVSAFSCVSVMPAEELDKLLEDVRSLGDNTLQDYNDVQVVVLHKEVGVGLGFSMAGGVDQSKPITVHKVFHSGVAAKEGSIREGDRVLSINGTALDGSAHWEAVRALRRAKTKEMGVVVLRRDDVTGPNRKGVKEKSPGPTQTQHETGQRVCVQLQKNSGNLGFSLEGGADSSEGNRPLTVQKVFLGGPVEKVCSGDEVLEIQGVSVWGMRRLQAWTLIRNLPPGPVDVVLHRPLKSLET